MTKRKDPWRGRARSAGRGGGKERRLVGGGERLTYTLALGPAPLIDSDQCRLCNQGSAPARVHRASALGPPAPASTIAPARDAHRHDVSLILSRQDRQKGEEVQVKGSCSGYVRGSPCGVGREHLYRTLRAWEEEKEEQVETCSGGRTFARTLRPDEQKRRARCSFRWKCRSYTEA